MSTKKIITTLLSAIIMLGVCSCGLLSTPKNQTKNFTYTVDDSLVQAIARAGGDPAEDPLCAVKITIKKSTGETLADETKSKLLSKLKGAKFEFGDLPLNTQMTLMVSVTADGKLVYESLPQTFTLENGSVKDIKAFIYRELDTPYMTWQEGYDEDGDWYSEYFSPGYEIPSDKGVYCFDGNNVLWTVDEDGYLWSSEKDEGPIPRLAYSESNNTGILDAKYDPITDKLVLMVGYYDSEDDEFLYFTTAVSPAELLTYEAEPLTKDMFELKELNAPEIEDEDWGWRPYDMSAYNNAVYMLFEIYDDEDNTEDLILRKVSLTTGDVLSETSLYDENSWPDEMIGELSGFMPEPELIRDALIEQSWQMVCQEAPGYYPSKEDLLADEDFQAYLSDMVPDSQFHSGLSCMYFNDLFVYKDTILIPFTQQICIDPQDYPPEADIPALLLDRGGILLIDAHTLQIKDIIGLAPVEDANINVSVPAYITGDYSATVTPEGVPKLLEFKYGLDRYGNPIQVFSDEEMENPLSLPLNTTASFKMGTGTKDSQCLRNPEKIIAIKPKKLVLADTGRFYYIDEDELKKQRSSRMVTVDLETFALTSVDILDGSIPQNDDFDVDFTITVTGDVPEDLEAIYGPEATYDSNGKFTGYNPDISPIELLSSDKISNLKLNGIMEIEF